MHRKHRRKPRIIQTPPDVKVHLKDDATTPNTLVKLVSVGDTVLGTHYATSHVEHWKHATLTGTSFTAGMTIESNAFAKDESEASLDDFLSGMTTEIETSRSPSWTQGKRTTPTGQTAYLYRMTNPDDSSKTVGILFEVDGNNRLQAVKFYQKAPSGPTGGIWTTKDFAAMTMTKQTSLEPKDLVSGTSNNDWWWA